MQEQTLILISQLCRWSQVREDLLYAFKQCRASGGLNEPMRSIVADLITRIQGGMPVDHALQLMQNQGCYEPFQDLVVAIRFNFRCRGNLTALLEQMETQLFHIEEERTRRRISTARDRRLCWLIVALGPAVAVLRLGSNPATKDAFLNTAAGPVLLSIGLALSVLAMLILIWLQHRLNS